MQYSKLKFRKKRNLLLQVRGKYGIYSVTYFLVFREPNQKTEDVKLQKPSEQDKRLSKKQFCSKNPGSVYKLNTQNTQNYNYSEHTHMIL